MTASAPLALVEPGRGAGLLDVVRHRFLLRLIVRQEMRVRYHGSVLGLFWSYVKPAVQFGVYFFALGVFLRLNRTLEDFAVYLFSGLVLINFFGEAFANASRSIVRSAPLVKKIYLPRELFPVAATYVAAIHLLPQIVVLFIGALFVGWTPSVGALFAAALGFSLVAVLVTGMGLLMAALNVYFRDVENIVDLILVVIVWLSPVLYPWSFAREQLGGGWAEQLYIANPLTIAAQLFQLAFWFPGVETDRETVGTDQLIPELFTRGIVALLVSLVLLGVGQLAFSRLESRFAQEL
ncbi:MAG: ABC transporter permease [Actinomycetota bacterium]|nr:ABC transporter permease [Actinomycetota bacterium]